MRKANLSKAQKQTEQIVYRFPDAKIIFIPAKAPQGSFKVKCIYNGYENTFWFEKKEPRLNDARKFLRDIVDEFKLHMQL